MTGPPILSLRVARMPSLPLAEMPMPPMSVEMVLSVLSTVVTGYFWLVRARQERPNLKIFQLRDFRATLRGGEGTAKRSG